VTGMGPWTATVSSDSGRGSGRGSDRGSDSDSGSERRLRRSWGRRVRVARGGMVTAGSSMPLCAVAAGEAGVKGKPASSRSLRDP